MRPPSGGLFLGARFCRTISARKFLRDSDAVLSAPVRHARRRWRMAGRCSGRLAARADAVRRTAGSACGACDAWSRAGQHATADLAGDVHIARSRRPVAYRRARAARSEEHTSELQSLMRISYAVFCLKKKNKT